MLPHTIKTGSRFGLIGFFAIAFTFSWSCWIPAALSESGFDSPSVRWLTYVGIYGPAAAGIALTHLSHDKESRADYWSRLTDVSRIRPTWLIPILLLYPAVTLLALFCDFALAGKTPLLSPLGAQAVSQPLSTPLVIVWLLLLGPLPEELGWRGYALDRLQRRWNALVSSLILGVLWAAWHLPLFFIKGSYQNSLGFGSLSFWAYAMTIVGLSVLFTWIYNNNARSILASILLHAVLNLSGAFLLPSLVAEVTKAIHLAIVIGMIIAAWTPGTLSKFRHAD